MKDEPLDTRPLPAPISLEDQLQALNAHASALPRLIAVSESGGVEVSSFQDGKPHHDSAEGKLFLAQDYGAHSANVFLRATALSQTVFELGKNDKDQWLILYSGKPSATISPVKPRADLLDASQNPATILRADLIPTVLAITEIVPSPEETIVMRVDDLRGVNDLLIQESRADNTAVAEREIIVDRRSGHVIEVDLFGNDGSLLVHALLDHYEPVTMKTGKPPQEGTVPSMPRHIVIDQPATHFRLSLTLATVDIPADIPAIRFETPDWSDQGITPTLVP